MDDQNNDNGHEPVNDEGAQNDTSNNESNEGGEGHPEPGAVIEPDAHKNDSAEESQDSAETTTDTSEELPVFEAEAPEENAEQDSQEESAEEPAAEAAEDTDSTDDQDQATEENQTQSDDSTESSDVSEPEASDSQAETVSISEEAPEADNDPVEDSQDQAPVEAEVAEPEAPSAPAEVAEPTGEPVATLSEADIKPAEDMPSLATETPEAEQAAEAATEAVAAQPAMHDVMPAQTPADSSSPVSAPAVEAKVDTNVEPAAATAAVAAGAAAGEAAPKNKGSIRKFTTFVLAPLFGLLILGGALFGGYVYYQLNRPENILLQSVAHTFEAVTQDKDAQVSSFKLDGTVELTPKGSDDTTTLDLDALVDVTTGNTELMLGLDLGLFKTAVSLGLFDDSAFVKVAGLDTLGQLFFAEDPATAGAIGQINEQWIAIEDALLDQAGLSLKSTAEVTEEEDNKVTQAFIDHRFVEFVEELESEQVDGVDAHHYKAVFNTAELRTWVADLQEINGEALGVSEDLVEIVNDLADEIDKTDYDMEIWIGKDDQFIRKITADVRLDDMNVAVALNMSGYNDPLTLAKPEMPISLGELLLNFAPLLEGDALDPNSLLGPLLSPSPSPADVQTSETGSSDEAFPNFTLGLTDE